MIPDVIEFPAKLADQEYGYRSFGRLKPCTRDELLARFSGWGRLLPPKLIWTPDQARLIPPVEWPPLVESVRRIRMWRWGLLLGAIVLVLLLFSVLVVRTFPMWKVLPFRRSTAYVAYLVILGVVPLFWAFRRFQDLRLAAPEEVAGVGASPRLLAWMAMQRPKAWMWIAGALLVAFSVQLTFGFWASLSAAALDDQSVRSGEYWRLLTGSLLHMETFHFVGNFIGVVISAWLIEALGRRWWVPVTFVVTALAGSVAGFSQSAESISAGASGAGFGLFGFVCVMSWMVRRQVPGLWKLCLWLLAIDAISLLGTVSSASDHLAHVVGLIAGAILAGVVVPRLAAPVSRRARFAGVAATVVIWVGALGVLIPTALKHDGIWGLHERGWRASRKGHHEAALRYYSQILDRDPRNRNGFAGKAASLNDIGDYEGAVRVYETWLACEPNNTDAMIGRAQSFQSMGQFARALEDLDRVLKTEPRNSTALADRAEVRLYSGFLDGALKDAHEACSLSPLDMDEILLSARLSQFSEDRLLDGIRALHVRGLVRTALSDYEGALADFWGVLQFNSNAEYVRPDIAEAYRLKGDLDTALKHFEMSLNEFKDDPDSLLGRARIRLARGEVEAARADLETALKSADRWWRLRPVATELLGELQSK